ncbi:MAG TPA: isoprenylcysteine carboxylmethyltransferase family protein [Flavitalea sp.]|nr:isoprenylcysteine carboxylmethyltransferase family protein [Flavitalea sp.]
MFTLQHIWVASGWVLYCTLHSLLANQKVKDAISLKMGNAFRFYRILYSIFAFATLAVLLLFEFSINGPSLLKPSLLLLLGGWLLIIPGFILMAIVIRKYFFELSGIQVFFRKQPRPSKLERGGLNRYSRHPLYLGTLMFAWGLLLLFPLMEHLIAVVVMNIYILVAMRWEEKKLVLEFGNEYKEYATAVPRLIPWKFK